MGTTNKNLTVPPTGSFVNTWGASVINPNMVSIDAALGSTYAAAFTSSNITLSATDALNLRYACTGTLGASVVLIFPTSVGGFWIVSNACSGAFTLSVRSGAGAAIVIPQGGLAFVTSDGTTAKFADGLAADGQLVYALDSGAADAYVTTTPFPVTLTVGATIRMKAANTNTGASTLNASATGATAIRDSAGSALTAGMITAGVIYDLTYNGTVWVMVAAVIPNGSVALAKLSVSGASQGAIIQRGASTWEVLATGAAGQVPVSGGAGANVAFATAARPLLATLTPSAAATSVFTSAQGLSNTLYAAYELDIENLTFSSSGASLLLRESIDGGSTYIATGSYTYIRTVSDSSLGAPVTSASVTATSIVLAANVGTGAGLNLSGSLRVMMGGAVQNGTKVSIQNLDYQTPNPNTISVHGWGCNQTASQIDAFQFLPDAGTITGTIRVYGIPK